MKIHEERLRRPSSIRSLQLGDLKLSYVSDGVVQLKPYGWLPGTTKQDWDDHAAFLDDTGNLAGSIGGLLVELGERALLIDAGVGPLSSPDDPDNRRIGSIRGGDLLDSLAKLGRRPADIKAVAFTHLHLDHLGWAWHPAPDSDMTAFTGADFLISEPEWTQRRLSIEQGTTDEMLARLAPRVRTIGDGEEIFPGVRMSLTPGHTIGHAAYTITSGGRRLIAFGDALHSPVQVGRPDWSAVSDLDSAESTAHRRRIVEELLHPDTIGFGIHFADVPFGRVGTTADGRPTWHPVA
ncbi:MBL fold metallo-hydrolase [Nonomuraea sp. K274]|uniref:MBL fold metallo-hydrolase n=1 Tax=Nonomuraea cypriaca TaxID=1187855 RepID=A0A931AJ24_9ACTN|nr:MBL fold metallo-hydrolase [Nonomuraea cypriaca]MBF8192838.1 MBL fold metallo-hydrolase [Nonomuraea cypriaca]